MSLYRQPYRVMTARKHLRKYWVEFEKPLALTLLNLGCGVTAFSEEDAIGLLKRSVGGLLTEGQLPGIRRIVADVRFEDLEQKHVASNIADMSIRGVWFPPDWSDFSRERQ